MSKPDKVFIFVLVILILVSGFFMVRKTTLTQKYQQAMEEVIKAEFNPYKIESQELYEGMQKVTLDVKGTILSPTPSGKATMFFKDGALQQIPDSFLRTLADQNKLDADDKIADIKFYENFDKFGPDSVYKNVYVATIVLKTPIDRGEKSFFGSPEKYNFLFFDKYGNLLFKTLGVAPINS